MRLKDWLFVIGVAVILLVSVSLLFDPADRYSPSRRKKRATGIRTGYLFAVMDLACVLSFLEWRRGLVRLGLPEAWSWVLAPIGLILVLATSMASWAASYGEGDNYARWWVAALILYIVAVIGYITVGFGPSAWFRS